MKWFLFLFGFYLLSLTTIPCSDNRDCGNERTAVTTIHGETGHDHTTEHCTPLCLCNCCNTVVAKLPLAPAVASEPAVPDLLKAALYPDQYLAGFSTSIWQPPKPVC